MNAEKPNRLTPVLIGATFLGVTSALPILEYLNCACCMLVIGGGILASFFYLRGYPPNLPPVTYGESARLGLLTGVAGGMVWTLVGIPLLYIKASMGLGMEETIALEDILSDPEIPEGLRVILEGLFDQGPLSLGIIFISVVTYFLLSTLFATLGGIIGLAIFQKKADPAGTVSRRCEPAQLLLSCQGSGSTRSVRRMGLLLPAPIPHYPSTHW